MRKVALGSLGGMVLGFPPNTRFLILLLDDMEEGLRNCSGVFSCTKEDGAPCTRVLEFYI